MQTSILLKFYSSFVNVGNCLPIFIKLHNGKYGFQFNGILLQQCRIPVWWRSRIVELRSTVMINIFLYFSAGLKVEEFLVLLWRKANAETTALQPIYSSQLTLSTQLIRANYIDVARQLLETYPLYSQPSRLLTTLGKP